METDECCYNVKYQRETIFQDSILYNSNSNKYHYSRSEKTWYFWSHFVWKKILYAILVWKIGSTFWFLKKKKKNRYYCMAEDFNLLHACSTEETSISIQHFIKVHFASEFLENHEYMFL